jgi:hypothetical protein
MSGVSDCSNKAILLGSLLGQLGEDYLFIYTPDHITVAVRQGRFAVLTVSRSNGKGRPGSSPKGPLPASASALTE